MTNYDKIRSMTAEELAVFLDEFYDSCDPDKCECFESDCKKCIRAWLRNGEDEMKIEDAIRISNAIEKMEEETMTETKQKTMMEDFFEKFPDAPRDKKGFPETCPDSIYDVPATGECSYDDDGILDCSKCWSRPVPPRRECYKNATVIVEYDKNGKPIISWVRQGDTIICPEEIYNMEIYNNCCPYDGACRACWSRPVPPRRECYKNATVIVEYDKNGKPIISWVRQEDTERIGYKEAMKRVMKVKANE